MSRWSRCVLALIALALAGCSGEGLPDSETQQERSSAATSRPPQPFASLRASTRALDAANGPPRLFVRPSRGLRDGERVIVNARGFWPEAKLFFSECPSGQSPLRATGCRNQEAAEVFAITNDEGAVIGYRPRVTANANGKPCRPQCVLAATGYPDHLATALVRFG